jgi:hypothetical protein
MVSRQLEAVRHNMLISCQFIALIGYQNQRRSSSKLRNVSDSLEVRFTTARWTCKMPPGSMPQWQRSQSSTSGLTASSQLPVCSMCLLRWTTRLTRLERFVKPWSGFKGRTRVNLTFTDDGYQLWWCLPVSCELLSPYGKVRLRRIDRSRRIDECFHCE